MHALMTQLFPLHRSMTGDGVRETLHALQDVVPLEICEVASGTQAFDWQVPEEWNLRDAWIKDSSGDRLVDYRESNLHVVGYSRPVHTKMRLEELEPHLHSLPEHPDWIPFRTAPFDDGWGFCLTHRQLETLRSRGTDAEFEVCIDALLRPGSLTYGELFLPGKLSEEVLISTHVCHPSMANDNLSGVVVAAFLAEELSLQPRRLGYRFLFVPATMGPIVWLASHEQIARRVQHGLVLACLGDAGQFTYKQSRRGNAPIDRAARLVLRDCEPGGSVREFSPFGYDERQYCSCGFNLPMGRLTRTPNGEYPEYHTSADDLQLVQPQYLGESLQCCLDILEVVETNGTYQNTHPYCEPPLKAHGLYEAYGASDPHGERLQKAVQWVLNLSDGSHSLLDIAERSRFGYGQIREAAGRLEQCHLLTRVDCQSPPAPLTMNDRTRSK